MDHQERINKSLFFNRDKSIKQDIVKINIGCGPNILPFSGWLNYDREDLTSYFDFAKTTKYTLPPKQEAVAQYLRNGGNTNFKIHDLRKGFPQHPDNSVDLIFFSQVIEHLNPIYETPKLLREFYRMLKPGGVVRIVTPDLDLLINAYKSGQMDKFATEQPEFYKDADPSAKLAYIMYGACGPECTFDKYEGHMFLFTRMSMTNTLKQAGFNDIAFYAESGQSMHDVMKQEAVDEGMSHSFAVEARK